jgi:hypothetical protein
MRLNTLNFGLPEKKGRLFPASCPNGRPGIEGGDFWMPFSISPILTQAQLLDSSSPPAVGEQIFVKSCQFVLLFLTQIFRGETLRGLRRRNRGGRRCGYIETS